VIELKAGKVARHGSPNTFDIARFSEDVFLKNSPNASNTPLQREKIRLHDKAFLSTEDTIDEEAKLTQSGFLSAIYVHLGAAGLWLNVALFVSTITTWRYGVLSPVLIILEQPLNLASDSLQLPTHRFHLLSKVVVNHRISGQISTLLVGHVDSHFSLLVFFKCLLVVFR